MGPEERRRALDDRPYLVDGSTQFLGQQVAYVLINGYAVPREVASLPKSQQFPVGYFELTNFKGTSSSPPRCRHGRTMVGPRRRSNSGSRHRKPIVR